MAACDLILSSCASSKPCPAPCQRPSDVQCEGDVTHSALNNRRYFLMSSAEIFFPTKDNAVFRSHSLVSRIFRSRGKSCRLYEWPWGQSPFWQTVPYSAAIVTQKFIPVRSECLSFPVPEVSGTWIKIYAEFGGKGLSLEIFPAAISFFRSLWCSSQALTSILMWFGHRLTRSHLMLRRASIPFAWAERLMSPMFIQEKWVPPIWLVQTLRLALLHGRDKCPFFMAKKLTFDQFGRGWQHSLTAINGAAARCFLS